MSPLVAPQELEAEERVCGALLYAGRDSLEHARRVAARVREVGLDGRHFYFRKHALVFDACLSLVERGEPCEALLVRDELDDAGALEEVGGEARLRELAVLTTATANAGHYAGKIMEAAERRARGEMDEVEGDTQVLHALRTLPPPSSPMPVAQALVDEHFAHAAGSLTVRHWRGGWWRWDVARWVEVEQRAIRAEAYEFTERAVYVTEKGEPKPWAPNRHRIADLLEALAAITHLAESISQPAWTNGAGYDGVLVSCANGLLDVHRRALLPHDPRFFNQTAVPFAYDERAPEPERWLSFLAELWAEDADSIAALRE